MPHEKLIGFSRKAPIHFETQSWTRISCYWSEPEFDVSIWPRLQSDRNLVFPQNQRHGLKIANGIVYHRSIWCTPWYLVCCLWLIATRTIPVISSCSDQTNFSMYTHFVWLWECKKNVDSSFLLDWLIQRNITRCIGKKMPHAIQLGYSTIKSLSFPCACETNLAKND